MMYISGPMTGLPELNFPKFFETADKLRGMGYEIVNPAEIEESDVWEECMREDIKVLMNCNSILVLDGWEKSRGATVEVFIGISLGMKVYNEKLELIDAKSLINKEILNSFLEN